MNGWIWKLGRLAAWVALPALAFGLTAWGQAVGGAFRLTGHVVGGGGSSQGGIYVLRGAVSQAAAGFSASEIVSGEPVPEFRAVGGWIGTLPAGPLRPPKMKVLFTADKLAELSWDVDIAGYVLEFSSSIGPDANWQAVDPQPTVSSFTTPCQQPARYFRLRGLQ